MTVAVVASDLDRTLIWSRAAATFADEALPPLDCVEMYEGEPLSYVTPSAATDLNVLLTARILLPVTTRTPEQYRRIDLPGPVPGVAICANGGRLLVGGVVDGAHSRKVESLLAGAGAGFAEVWDWVRAGTRSGGGDLLPFVKTVRAVEDLFVYVVCHTREIPQAWIEGLAARVDGSGWRLSVQGRKVYVVPAALSKGWALGQARDRFGAGLVLAAGDSLLDAALLDAADVGMAPRASELEHHGYEASHVEFTSARGARAGEEIVRWMRVRAVPASVGGAC